MQNLSAKMAMMLSDNQVRTVGDETGTKARMGRGVPQDSPHSPSLFNAYIDDLVEMKNCAHWRCTEVDVTLFADDVVVFARNGADA